MVLKRDCDWRNRLFAIENQLGVGGWVHFVIFAEIFSGKFRLECVENLNKYLQKGYISTFFDNEDLDLVETKGIDIFLILFILT